MRAVDVRNGSGPAENLFITEIPTPVPQAGELLIRVKAFGLNRMDLYQREGKYPLPPSAPKTLGVEFAGTVEEVGTGATGFETGDAVFGLAYGGAYAEFIAVNAGMVIRKPASLSFVQAAAIPEVWITAIQALWTVGGFKKGDSVLIHAGASGIGIAAIQLAVKAGASAVFATAGSQEKLDFCTKELGATAAFDYKTQDFEAEILKATDGRGVDIIVDPVGQTHIPKDINAAAKDGRIVLLAMMSGSVVERVDFRPVLYKRLRIEGTTLRSRTLDYQIQLKEKIVKEALPGFESGELKIYVENAFDWEQIADMHRLMESNGTRGKLIGTIGRVDQ